MNYDESNRKTSNTEEMAELNQRLRFKRRGGAGSSSDITSDSNLFAQNDPFFLEHEIHTYLVYCSNIFFLEWLVSQCLNTVC